MDASKVRPGELIAGAAGVALILIMFIFDWFGAEGFSGGVNAWQALSVIDIVLFVVALSGIALALVAAMDEDFDLPVPLSAIVAGLGILAVILVLFRIISPPDFGETVDTPLGEIGGEVDGTRKIGLWFGLIASAALAYGGWRAMQDEQAGLGAPSPPPPPPPSPPPAA